jgi:hypothetical protein
MRKFGVEKRIVWEDFTHPERLENLIGTEIAMDAA